MTVIICTHCGAPGEMPAYVVCCPHERAHNEILGECPYCGRDNTFNLSELRDLGVAVVSDPINN